MTTDQKGLVDLDPRAVAVTDQPGPVQQALRRIADMAAMPSNWDSCGAQPPSAVAVGEAAVLIEAVADTAFQGTGTRLAPWTSSPIADGGLQVEWAAPGRRIEVQVGPDGSLGYLIEHVRGGRREYEEVEEAPFDDVVSLVVRLLAR